MKDNLYVSFSVKKKKGGGGLEKLRLVNWPTWAEIFFTVHNPFYNMPFWDHSKFKEAAGDNWNVAIKEF